MKTATSLVRLLTGRKYWWTTILVVLGMIVLSRLGMWQLERLEQRRASNLWLSEQAQRPAVVIEAPEWGGAESDLKDRAVVVTGRFDYDNQIILTQQTHQTVPGAHLVTPLILSADRKAILIDRGWISASDLILGRLERFNEELQATIEGTARKSQELEATADIETERSGASGQSEWYRVDVAAIGRQLPYDLLPYYVVAWPPPGEELLLPARVKPELDLSEGSHLSYAIQWFAFALILLIVYLRIITRGPTSPPEPGNGQAAPDRADSDARSA